MKLGAGVYAPYKPSANRKHVGPSLGGGIKALGVGLFVTSVPVVTQASTAPFFNKATFGGLSDEMCYPEIVAVPSHGPTELTTGSLKPTTESPASGDTEDTGIVAGVYAGGVVTVGGIIAVGVFSGNRANVMAAAVGGVVGTALLPVMMCSSQYIIKQRGSLREWFFF